MAETSVLSNSDVFFYYGKNDLGLEIESEVLQGLVQPKKTLFYFRNDGCDLSNYEGYPNGFALQIQVRYDIVKWSSYRNGYVPDGNFNLPDRRVAVSQNSIDLDASDNNLDVNVMYIPYFNYKNPNTISVPLGVK
jgi:hypothetical protein